VVVFSITTDTFLTSQNLSLVLQQSIVIGTLALGQSLIILTGGIDLANGAIAVLGTIVMAKLAFEGSDPGVALLLGLAVATFVGLVNGLLVARLGLPPFIVTLGALTVVFAVSRLYAGSRSYQVTSDLLLFWGNGIQLERCASPGGRSCSWAFTRCFGTYSPTPPGARTSTPSATHLSPPA